MIRELTVREDAEAILFGWLSAYFDGGRHAIGAVYSGQFPHANLTFGKGRIQQPINLVDAQAENTATPQMEIRLVIIGLEERDDTTAPGMTVTSDVQLQFWVKGKKQGKGQGRHLIRHASDLLHALLKNPMERVKIAAQGIAHLRPKPPREIEMPDYTEVMAPCRAQFIYDVNTTVLAASSGQPAPGNVKLIGPFTLTPGLDYITLSGLGLPFTPVVVYGTVGGGDGSIDLDPFGMPEGLTADGFTQRLNTYTPASSPPYTIRFLVAAEALI